MPKPRPNRICIVCGKEFHPPLNSSKYCSHPCFISTIKGKALTGIHRQRVILARKRYPTPCSETLKKKYSALFVGKARILSDEARKKMSAGRKGKPISAAHRAILMRAVVGKKRTPEQRQAASERAIQRRKEKGAAPSPYPKLRLTAEYRIWARAVKRRDNFICCFCGVKPERKRLLHAHHILSFTKYPELRHDIENGLSLCKTCHRGVHGKAKKNNLISMVGDFPLDFQQAF